MTNDWRDYDGSNWERDQAPHLSGHHSKHRAAHGHPGHHHHHGPHHHHALHGDRPHHDAQHGPHGHLHPRHGQNRSQRFLNSASYQGALATLEKLLPPSFANWLLRAMQDCPPEMLALFRLHVSMVEHQLATLAANGVEAPTFGSLDLAEGADSLSALSISLPTSQQHGCLEDLMRGPLEVQAVSFVSLVSLRLAALAFTAPVNGEVKADA